MKKLLLITLAFSIFINFSLVAQEKEIKTYKNFVGGSFNIHSSKGASSGFRGLDGSFIYNSKDASYHSINLLPTIGCQLNDKNLIGVMPIINYYKSTGDAYFNNNIFDKYTSTSNIYGLGIFLRRQIYTYNNFYFYLEPSFSVSSEKYVTSYDVNNTTSSTNSITGNIGVSPVVSFQVAPRFRFLSHLGNLGFTGRFVNANSTIKSNNVTSFNANFGLSYIYFGGEFLF